MIYIPAREDTILIEFDIDDSPLIALEKQIKEMYDQMTGGQINEFEDNLSDIVGVAKDASEGVEDLNESFRELDELIEGLSGDFDNMSKGVAGLGEDVDKVSKGVKGVGKSGKGLSPFIEGLRGIAGNADLAQKATEQLAKDAKRLQAVGAGLKSFFGAVGKAALAGMAAAGAGLLAIGKKSIDIGMQFEQGLSSIKAVSGASESEMQALEAAALKAGEDTVYSAGESAAAIEELLKAGLSVEQVLGGGLTGALTLASAGEVEVADAAEIAATVLNAFKDDALSVGEAADILAGAANASATDVMGLKMGLSQASAVASGMGMTFEDTATGLAVFAQNGLKGSDAGTSLKTMLMNLQPTTDKQNKLFSKLGLLTKDGASAFYDATGSLKPLNEIAGLLKGSMEDLTDAERSLALETMFGSDAVRAGNILFREGKEGVDAMNKSLNEVKAADVAAERLNNLAGKIEGVSGSLETLGIKIYKSASGPLNEFVDLAGESVDRLSKAFDTGGFSGMTAILGQELSGWVSKISEKAPEFIASARQLLQNFITGIENNLPDITSSAVKMATELAMGLLQDSPQFLRVGAKFIYGVLDGLIAELPNVLTSLAGIPQQMGDTLSSNLSGALQGILQILNDLGNTFLGVAQAALPPFIGLISFAAGLIANHTGIIKALVVGLLIYKAAQIGVNIAMQAGMVVAALSKAWAVASAVIMMFQSGASFATVAQWALNAAMAANPVGLVVIGVMALIGVILLVVKYWDDLKEAFSTGLDFIANMFDRLALGLANIMPEWLYKLLGGDKQEAVLAIETKMDDRAEKTAARREELEAKKAAKKAEKASKESDPFSMFGMPDSTGMTPGFDMPPGYAMPSNYSMGMPQPDAAAFQPSASSMDSLNYMKADAGATDVWDSYFNAGAQIGPAYAAGMESSMHMPVDAAGGMIEQVDAAVLQPTSSSMDSLNYLQTGVETTTSAISADTLAMSTDYSSQMTAMQTATETGMTAINTTVSAGLASIKSSINAVDLQSDGANLVQGLINGMNSKLGAVKAAASAIANAAKTSVQGALDMHSPSRIMEALGGFTTEGFASGILNGMQTAMASMRTVAQGVLGVMGGTHGALQPAYAGGYTPENTTGAGKSISNINNSTQSTTTTNAPSFTLNMSNSSGSTATDVREMVFAALDEYFGAQDRTANRRKD